MGEGVSLVDTVIIKKISGHLPGTGYTCKETNKHDLIPMCVCMGGMFLKR